MPNGAALFEKLEFEIARNVADVLRLQATRNVRVTAEATAVRLRFETTWPAFATVEVFRMATGEVTLDMEKENLVRTSVELSGNPKARHDGRLPGLEQERRFWFRLSVPQARLSRPGAKGKIRARGEFATLRRDVSIDIGQIHVFDDSDTSGSGELDFSLGAYDAAVDAGPSLAEPRFSQGHQVASGGDVDSPFGGPLDIGRAPDRIGVYVLGVDNDASFWNAPFVGLGLVGLRPPDRMPGEVVAKVRQGFDLSEALGTFGLRGTLGRGAFPISIASVHGALHYEVRGSALRRVTDTLGQQRQVPPWKKFVPAKMQLARGGRRGGLVGLRDARLALAPSDEGRLSRREDGSRQD